MIALKQYKYQKNNYIVIKDKSKINELMKENYIQSR